MSTSVLPRARAYADSILENTNNGPIVVSKEAVLALRDRIEREVTATYYCRRVLFDVKKVLRQHTRHTDYERGMKKVEELIPPNSVHLETFQQFRAMDPFEQAKRLCAMNKNRPIFAGNDRLAASLNFQISKVKVTPEELDALQPSSALRDRLDHADKNRNQTQSNRVVVLPGEQVYDLYATFVAPTILDAGKGNYVNRTDLAIALSLATGRRTSELLLTGSFEPIKGKSHVVRFRGQLKKCGYSSLDTTPLSYPIPTLVPSMFVCAAVKVLRNLFPLPRDNNGQPPTPEDVNRRYSGTLGRASCAFMKTLLRLGPDDTPPPFHFYRTIYAMVTFEARKPRGTTGIYKTPTLHAHVQQVLGHDSQDVSKHYARLQVDGDVRLRIDFTGDE
jgi:hypothetical protein